MSVAVASTRGYETLFHRSEKNPILTAADWPYPVHTVFNPGATRLSDGTTLLLCRVEDRRGLSHLSAARSANGIDGWPGQLQETAALLASELATNAVRPRGHPGTRRAKRKHPKPAPLLTICPRRHLAPTLPLGDARIRTTYDRRRYG